MQHNYKKKSTSIMRKNHLVILFLSLIAFACSDNNQMRVIDLSQPQVLDDG